MSSNRCRVTVTMNGGHSDRPVSPSNCQRIAAADCYATGGGYPLSVNTCTSKTTVNSWQREDTCFEVYKCQGCFWVCSSAKGPG
jgi:hypothetical protein